MMEHNEKTTGAWTYKIYPDGKNCRITLVEAEHTDELIIPDTIDGYCVASIGERAFSECGYLASVSIPDSVNGIKGATLVGIGKVEVSPGNPSYCSVDGNLYSKDRKTLLHCDAGVTELRIPDSVTCIADSALFDCASLANVIIPDSVTEIGEYAFGECASLTSVSIPASVTCIGCGAFDGVGKVEVSHGNPSYCSVDGNLYSKDRKTLLHCDAGITELRVPASVTRIVDDAFSGCASLKSVILSDSVTTICNFTFYRCENLVSMVIPASVACIDLCAFYACENLANLRYGGTKQQWEQIYLTPGWNEKSGIRCVLCEDGSITL